MMQKILYPLLLVFVMLFASCQKEIEVDIPDYEQKIVIEGSIEAGEPAMVMVSRSISYFADIDIQTLYPDADERCLDKRCHRYGEVLHR